MITLIAAMSHNRVIGKDNTLPWDYPEDLQRFRMLTRGKPIVMGRRTYESIGRPLPKRRNIVLTSQSIDIPGVEIFHDIASIVDATKGEAEVMIIGGQTIYEQFLPYADKIELTLIKKDVDGDTFFPVFEDVFVEKSREVHAAFDFITYKKD